jgi:hypothetical protein
MKKKKIQNKKNKKIQKKKINNKRYTLKENTKNIGLINGGRSLFSATNFLQLLVCFFTIPSISQIILNFDLA